MQEKEEELTNLLFHVSIGFGLPVGLWYSTFQKDIEARIFQLLDQCIR